MCYAGFAEVNITEKININEEISMTFFQRIGILFRYIIDSLKSGLLFFNNTHYAFCKIRLDYYIVAVIILIYAILNFLIVRKKKELSKISIKINIIILLILLVISTLNITNITNIYELIFIILALLITSLVFQKVILKKDDDKTKKYNRILKMIMIVFIIIEFVICVIAYTFIFSISEYDSQKTLTGEVSLGEYIMYEDIDISEPILVEMIEKIVLVAEPTSYKKDKYTISIGESINDISENKVLNIDNEGLLLEYINFYCKEKEDISIEDIDSKNYFTPYEKDILNRYEYGSEKVQKKLKWNTWYSWALPEYPDVFTEGYTETYIRVIKNK